MPSQYILKNPPIDKNRVQKICKKVIDEANDDRKLALDAHRFFREMIDENAQDATAKNLMVDCLKLAQTAKGSILKVGRFTNQIRYSPVKKLPIRVRRILFTLSWTV